MFQSGSANYTMSQETIRFAVIGLCRDLRGIASSCTKKSNFTLFLNWAYGFVFLSCLPIISLANKFSFVKVEESKILEIFVFPAF